MAKINENFTKLPGNYLFSHIGKKVAEYQKANPYQKIIRLGIGDVTLPLSPSVIKALHDATEEMAKKETFKGYGPEQGYRFLRDKIVEYDYQSRGIDIEADEIFISDGAKSDMGNIGDIFHKDNVVAISDPVYPVYVDTNVMAGRAGELNNSEWSNIVYMECYEENNFLPHIPTTKADLIYLCFPNNPTGSVITKDELRKWVDYANENDSIIFYDGAYEKFITEEDIPHSIYEIEGAKECAIEFRSFSKTAGFTGLRCGYTVVPKKLKQNKVSLNGLWNRRQSTKFNGTSYIIQRGAAAIYSEEGQREIDEMVKYYLKNASSIARCLRECGFKVFGGVNSPYVWVKTPMDMKSWDFFDVLLNELSIVSTPGIGFGPCGEGYLRLTGFGSKETTEEAIRRIENIWR